MSLTIDFNELARGVRSWKDAVGGPVEHPNK